MKNVLNWQQFNETKSKEEQIKEITDDFDKVDDKKKKKDKMIKDITDKFDFDEKPKDKEEEQDGFTKHLANKYGKKRDKI